MKVYYDHDFISSVYTISRRYDYSRRPTSVVYELVNDSYTEETVFLQSFSSFETQLKALNIKPKSGDKLYFHKTSNYPRFKLQYSDFKRCIKLESADVVVYDSLQFDKTIKSYNTAINYRATHSECVFIKDNDKYILATTSDFAKISSRNEILPEMIKNNLVDENAEILYSGNVVSNMYGRNWNDFIVNVIENIFPGVISDTDLDAMINGNCETLDEESLMSIQDMLQSTDSTVVGMGLKLLTNYNVDQYRATIKVMLDCNIQNIKNSSAWNLTAIKQLRQTLNYKEPYNLSFPNCILCNPLDKNIKYSPQDLDLVHKIVAKGVKNYISSQNKQLEKNLAIYKINIDDPNV